ncbi:MAG TPA: lysylphosphatidylglycerol synthase transmembrane domain-containing protein [Gemmatimonadaceae bacterium]|nr:lysylphosphatidylglycerol synthase transmembrane domain-containing protein [Gemmatimonadaceae bacterium]
MKLALRVTVSGALLALLIAIIPWREAWDGLQRLSPWHWAAVLVLFVAAHLLGTIKWRMMVNAGRARLGYVDAVMCYFAGLFANICLPSIVGGDVLRAALAGRLTRRPEAAVWGGVADRLSDLLATALLIVGGALLARGSLPGVWSEVLTVLLVVGLVVGASGVPFLLRRPLAKWPRRVRRAVGRSLVSFRRMRRSPGVTAMALTLSLIIQGTFVLLNASLGRAIGVQVELAVWFLVWPLAKVSGLLPISLGGLAVREATLAALLLPFGVPIASGVVAALLWQTVMICGGLIGGALWTVLARRRGAGMTARDAMRRAHTSSPAHV